MAEVKCPPKRFSNSDCGDEGWQQRKANLSYPPIRYTAEEWNLAEVLTHDAAESEQQASEWVQAEAARLTDETREITLRAQQDIDYKFKQRLREVEHWRDELKRNFGDLNDEIDAMTIYRKRLENALATLCHIITVNSEIVAHRECRLGVDLVHDEPQKQVLHEIKIVYGIDAVLKRNVEQCTEMLRLVRKCTVSLGRQLKDKDIALEVDKLAYNLDEHRAEVQRHCEKVCMSDSSGTVTEKDWIEATEKSKLDAEKAVNASIQYRTVVDSVLRQVCEDLQREVCATNDTFEKRLKEIIAAKARLEEQHSQVSIRIREMDGTICKLTKAFEEKQTAVALAETRLCVRGKRPNLESIKDPLQRRLLMEIDEENESMARLNRKILEANISMRNLQRNQLDLEDAINIKLNTIGIDETKVMPIRKTIRIQEF